MNELITEQDLNFAKELKELLNKYKYTIPNQTMFINSSNEEINIFSFHTSGEEDIITLQIAKQKSESAFVKI